MLFGPSKQLFMLGASALAIAALAAPDRAHAQAKTGENAVTGADDAFGTSIGFESSGIYSSEEARGFSPTKAGNVRIDGIYIDPVASISFRLRASQAIRIGYAALDYPFPAPTGIVDNRLRTASDKFHAGVALHRTQYGGFVKDLDVQFPIEGHTLGMAAGVSHGHAISIDGSTSDNFASLLKPVVRWSNGEFSPFFSYSAQWNANARPLVVLAQPVVPDLPPIKQFYGSDWARNSFGTLNTGATLRTIIPGGLILRAGVFRSSINRKRNFTEIFAVTDRQGNATHRVIADPLQRLHSWSGEAQLAWRFGSGHAQHRLIAGFRLRDRHTESGGSDSCNSNVAGRCDYGSAVLGQTDPDSAVKPDFQFTPVNQGVVRQTSFLLGYVGKVQGAWQLNLGIQRNSFRASFTDSLGTSRTRENHWLYNASIGVDLSPSLMLFGGTQRGLEDSGAAPETATNRNEQLPPTLSTQYEAGLRWKHNGIQAVLSAFQISKPYFSFDQTGRYDRIGTVRHRGVEVSISGHVTKRLFMLAGAVAMKPEVSGPARDLGLAGERPAGTASVFARLDANYRTDILGGLTPTLSVTYQGKRAAGSRPLPGGGQLMLPAYVPIDIGLRLPLKIFPKVPATVRFLIQNINDAKSWKVLASNTLQPEERRRGTLELLLDF